MDANMAVQGNAGAATRQADSSVSLWRYLVIGMIAVIGVSVILIGVLLAMKVDPAVLVTLVTAALTGLLGLFVPPSKSAS